MEISGKGICYASFGEILQGVLSGGRKFLVTLRICDASRVTLWLSRPQYSAAKELRFAQSYCKYPKSYKMLRNIMSDLGSHDDCFIEIDSDIPVGKGLSSSTADMVASIRSLSEAMSIALKPDYVSRMMTEIEPNDGLHYDGTIVYHHTMGELVTQFDYVPPLQILGIDFGDSLDTVEFNQRDVHFSEAEMQHYQQLADNLQEALEQQDVPRICEIATESTLKWQKVNEKRELERVTSLVHETGAMGIANAHSGTYLGILYDKNRHDQGAIMDRVGRAFPHYSMRWFMTTSCGTANERTR